MPETSFDFKKELKLEFEQLRFTCFFIDDKHLKVVVEGHSSAANIQDALLAFDEFIRAHKHLYILADLSALEFIPWTKRSLIIKLAEAWYQAKHVDHICFIRPSAFIRMASILISAHSQKMSHSFESSEAAALLKLKPIPESAEYINIIQQGLHEKRSVSWFKIIETIPPINGSGPIEYLICEPNILVTWCSGSLGKKEIESIYEHVDRAIAHFGRIHFIADLSNVKSIESEGRRLILNNAKKYNEHIIRRHMLLPPLLKPLLKISNFILPKFGERTRQIKSLEEGVLGVIQEQYSNMPKTALTSQKEFDTDILKALTKEELIDVIKSFREDNIQMRETQKKHIEAIYAVVSKITWSENFNKLALPELESDNSFYDLYQAMNILQNDISQMIKKLQDQNSGLEESVISSFNQLRLKESNLRSLIQNYRSPIWMVDTSYNLMEYNSVFEIAAKLAYDIDLHPGCRILSIMPEPYAELWRERYDKARTGVTVNYKHSEEVAGEMKHFEILVYPIYVNKEIAGIGVITNDVTEIEVSKEKLEVQNRQLTKLNYELDTFMYRSTHDMRAPVATIMGLIDVALAEASIEEKDRCLRFMLRSTERMDHFIREIADITKNSKFDIKSELVNFDTLLSDILLELAQGNEYNVVKTSFAIYGESPFYSDLFRLKTILRNLISNAIKYARKEAESTVHIKVTIDSNFCEIAVEDNGQGIRQSELERIFDMFHRANESSDGSGLGLYIVKELIDKLGGNIKVSSTYGKGSVFMLQLPSLK